MFNYEYGIVGMTVALGVTAGLAIGKLIKKNDKRDVIKIDEIREICKMATIQVSCEGVAKMEKESVFKFLKCKKHMWLYENIDVTVGVDIHKMKTETHGKKVTITIPKAEVLSCIWNPDTVKKYNFNEGKNFFVRFNLDDEKEGISYGVQKVKDQIMNDQTLLENAQKRVCMLISQWIESINNHTNNKYELNLICENV